MEILSAKLTSVLVITVLAGIIGATAPQLHTVEKQKTVLAVGNAGILYYAGVERKVRPLDRHADNPLIASGDTPRENILAYCSLYHDQETGRYQMWYQSCIGPQAEDKMFRCVVCYVEFDDGTHWQKPELDLLPFKDS